MRNEDTMKLLTTYWMKEWMNNESITCTFCICIYFFKIILNVYIFVMIIITMIIFVDDLLLLL